MVGAAAAQMVEHRGGGNGCLLAGRDLAVQNPQRIGLRTTLTVAAQVAKAILQIIDQGLAIGRPAFLAAQRVDVQFDVVDTDGAEIVTQHGQDLGIDFWIVDPDSFNADLMKLAVASLLGPFVAKHGAQVV